MPTQRGTAKKLNVVLYSDWAYDGTGYRDYARGLDYSKTRVTLHMALPPSTRARTLTVSRATGEGFEAVGTPITVAAGQKTLDQMVEIMPLTGLSLTVQ